jgi:molecular chaperone DnaK (HSP70)
MCVCVCVCVYIYIYIYIYRRVMDHMVATFKKKHKVDPSKDKKAIQKLRREVERAYI